ncbi:hypothetical protein [Mycobacterium sp. C31M]
MNTQTPSGASAAANRARTTMVCVVRILVFMFWLVALIAVGIGATSGHSSPPVQAPPAGAPMLSAAVERCDPALVEM